MPRRRALALLCAAMLLTGCRQSEPQAPAYVTGTRPAGSWQGRGSQMLGFVSESGRFTIAWETRNEMPPGGGSFKVTVHSAVSGRPLHVAVDHRGAGRGTVRVDDDPRQYNLMVESANVDWSVAVDELIAVPAPGSPRATPDR
jgi:hypothetical protein